MSYHVNSQSTNELIVDIEGYILIKDLRLTKPRTGTTRRPRQWSTSRIG